MCGSSPKYVSVRVLAELTKIIPPSWINSVLRVKIFPVVVALHVLVLRIEPDREVVRVQYGGTDTTIAHWDIAKFRKLSPSLIDNCTGHRRIK